MNDRGQTWENLLDMSMISSLSPSLLREFALSQFK